MAVATEVVRVTGVARRSRKPPQSAPRAKARQLDKREGVTYPLESKQVTWIALGQVAAEGVLVRVRTGDGLVGCRPSSRGLCSNRRRSMPKPA
jgi:hypothetical protein